MNKLKKWIILYLNQFTIRKLPNNRCEENEKVLVIKLDAIGDFIIWLDSAKEYKNLYPNKKCVLLCNEACKGLGEVTRYFDEIITLDISRFEIDKTYCQEQLTCFSSMSFNTVIQTAYSRTQHMDIIAATIPAKTKIAFEADESKSNLSRSLVTKKNKKKLDSIYDSLIPASKGFLMELRRNAEFIKGLGKKDFVSSTPVLPKINYEVKIDGEYCVIFPGASTNVKRWSIDKYAEVVNYILAKSQLKILVCGSKSEINIFYELESIIDCTDERLINYCGKVSLINLIEVVRKARFVLSNDTSGIHYAAATGIPAICPFGEYNYGRFLPYDANINLDCISVVSPGMKCRGCANGYMTMSCIMHILKTGRYECMDKIECKSIIQIVNSILLKEKNENTY